MPRRYTDEQRAAALAALAANDGNVLLTAKQLGIPESSIREWRDGKKAAPPTAMVAAARKPLADRLEDLCYLTAEKLVPALDDAGARDLSVTLAILVDKMRLLREQPTAISGTVHNLNHEERSARIADILRAANCRAAGDAHAGRVNGTGNPPGPERSMDPLPGPPNGRH